MKTLTVSQQIDLLRPAVRSGFAGALHRWLIGGSLGLVVLGLVLWHPVPLMIAAFMGLVGVAERQAGPNLVAAVRAFDEGTPSPAEATIEIVSGDVDDHYHVLIRQVGHPDSQFEFIPQGWLPEAGIHRAQVWRAHDAGPPVLATTEGGALIPRSEPSMPD